MHNVVGSCLYALCDVSCDSYIDGVVEVTMLNFRVKAFLLSPNASNNGQITIDPKLDGVFEPLKPKKNLMRQKQHHQQQKQQHTYMKNTCNLFQL
jgi:hypothetical protein